MRLSRTGGICLTAVYNAPEKRQFHERNSISSATGRKVGDTVGRGPGCRFQVYFPPRRRRLIARQRRHVNDGNDGADEAKANGCIQRTKALLCSRHVIDGEWFTVSLPDAGEKRLSSNALANDAPGATRRGASARMHS